VETLYKITLPDGTPCHGGSGLWPLPEADEPGAWRSIDGAIIPCSNGLHLCETGDLHDWLKLGAAVWEAEAGPRTVRADNKTVAASARLLRLVGILSRDVLVAWAADCAEHVLPLFEARFPDDKRPRKAAAADAAYAAADAAYAAAYAAAAAAYAAADAAAYAADAAYAAAYAAARRRERDWQNARLLEILRAAWRAA
jgi:hypothetical protein